MKELKRGEDKKRRLEAKEEKEAKKKIKLEQKLQREEEKKLKQEINTCKGCDLKWKGSSKWMGCEHCDEYWLCPDCALGKSLLKKHERECGK